MRIGLVLGAGGVVGAAYHAGALTALEHDLGWDPRTADVIVGTSAGSVVGALLRLGVSPSDVAAHTVGALQAATHPLVTEGFIPNQDVPQPPATWPRWPRPAGLGLWRRWLTKPWTINPMSALTAMLPDGTVPLGPHLAYLDLFARGSWPQQPLWLPAVSRRTLRRVVFGRHDLLAPLSSAVAASCAIPGYMAPVRIGSDHYVDGGVHSPTNADVLRRHPLDLAIVLAPMCAARVTGFGTDSAVRRMADHTLRREVRKLEAAGIPVVSLVPAGDALRAMGSDFMSADHVFEVVRESFLGTGRQLLTRRNRELLAPLSRHIRLAA